MEENKENSANEFIEETKSIEEQLIDEKESIGEEQLDAKIDEVNNNSKKLLNIVYLIIIISIGIAMTFYVKQLKAPELNKEITNSGATSTGIKDEIKENIDIKNSSGVSDLETKDNVNNSSTGGNTIQPKTPEEKKKNEEAIVKDFEKELDGLFDIIDKNGK